MNKFYKGQKMIELQNIKLVKNNKKILDNINLTIEDNRTTVITGPNGSGKSTLMKVIVGIEQITSGKIFYNGEDITNTSITDRANKGISYAMQQPVRFKGITVKDLFKLASKNCATNEALHTALSNVGLCPKNYLNREVDSSLSGGELKRIEIASVLLKKSNILIFDEPEAGIDIWSFNKLINLFNDLCKKLKLTIVIVSHQEKIIGIADNIVLIKNGKIQASGEKEKMLPILNENKTIVKKCKRAK